MNDLKQEKPLTWELSISVSRSLDLPNGRDHRVTEQRFNKSFCSRVESGDRLVNPEELNAILEAIGTDEAMDLQERASREWHQMPRPPLEHPNEPLLWDAEQALHRISCLAEEPNLNPVFAKRVELFRTELDKAASLVWKSECNIAFVGNIGVGKTTALCRIADLEIQNEAGISAPVLDVGGGGVTICDVHIAQGPGYGLFIEPKSEIEPFREVREFSRALGLRKTEAAPNPDFLGNSKEVERVIRNMSGLSVERTRGPDGRRERLDHAMKLAESIEDPDHLALIIQERMNLPKRTKRVLWYSKTSNQEPLQWLKENFVQLNRGLHPEFSMPQRIEVRVPQRLLGEESLSIRLIDTRGIDATAERKDLELHFNDPYAIVILCSNFNDAPSTSIQQLLERAVKGQYSHLGTKVSVLVLPHPGEALAVKDDAGFSVETVSEGYELKEEQAQMNLQSLGLPKVRIEFFNILEEIDESERFTSFLLEQSGRLRDLHCSSLKEIINGANDFVQNRKREQIWEIQKEAARHLITWTQEEENRRVSSFRRRLQDSLLEAIQDGYASSLHASVRRVGEWDNLDYAHQLGYGARTMAADALERKLSGLKEIARNLLRHSEFTEASDLILQVIRVVETETDNLLYKCQLMGRGIYTRYLEPDRRFWNRCNKEWGEGPGYRKRVIRHHRDWFDEKHYTIEKEAREFIDGEWKRLLGEVENILPNDLNDE